MSFTGQEHHGKYLIIVADDTCCQLNSHVSQDLVNERVEIKVDALFSRLKFLSACIFLCVFFV